MTEWRDIESAPKDGTPLLLFARAVHATASVILVGWWLPGQARWVESSFTRPCGVVPTYWMPMPPLPSGNWDGASPATENREVGQ